MKLEEEKRVIFLGVKAKHRLLSVNSHNLYEGVLRLDKGIPQTTSNDQSAHGFGIKSMMMIVQKYDGTISFNTENGVFNVNILFPLKAAEALDGGMAP